jgi:hypothetical protein
MTDATLKRAADIQQMFLEGRVSHATAQQRLRWSPYRLNDAALLAELQRRGQAEQAAAEAAEARTRRQDAKVNDYIRREHERTRGIDINGF